MQRLRTVYLLLVPLAAWVLSQLTPAAAGFGTHEQLGLPPCPWHALTGWRCPTCGLTTSLCYLLHGEWAAAWRTHPLGPPTALAVLLFWLWLATYSVRGAAGGGVRSVPPLS